MLSSRWPTNIPAGWNQVCCIRLLEGTGARRFEGLTCNNAGPRRKPGLPICSLPQFENANDFTIQLGLSLTISTSEFLNSIEVCGQGLPGLVKAAINGLFRADFTASIMVRKHLVGSSMDEV